MINDIHFHEHDSDDTEARASLQLEHEGVSYRVHTVSKRVRTQGSGYWRHSIARWKLGEDDADGPDRPLDELPDDVAAEAYECLEGNVR